MARPAEIGHQLEVLLAGQQFVDRGELAGDPDGRAHGLGLRGHVVPGDARRAAVGPDQRGQHVDCGRLARPVRAEQREDGAGFDVEIDAVQDDLVLVCLSQPRGCYR
jgi:hypothetical protein